MKNKGSKPVRLVKAFLGCTALFCIPGLIITFMAQSAAIELIRINRERVDAAVVKKVLFIIPISNSKAASLLSSESQIMDGGLIRQGGSSASSTGKITGEAEDEGILMLHGQKGESIEVNISPENPDDVKNEINYFITESTELSLRLWVVSNWKFGVILPGGILLFCLAVFFLSAWSIITGMETKSRSS